MYFISETDKVQASIVVVEVVKKTRTFVFSELQPQEMEVTIVAN